MQDINLDLDKENELVFQLSVEGAKPAKVESRFLIDTGNYSLSFPAGPPSSGEVSVSIPPLENTISEGKYSSSLEVIVDGKVFTPININTEFTKSITIVAEVVTKKKSQQGLSVSPTISVNKVKMNINEDKEKLKKLEEERAKEEKLEKILKEERKASRPAQRSGRPGQNKRTQEANRSRLIETHIRNASRQSGKELSEDQILKLTNFIKNKGEK